MRVSQLSIPAVLREQARRHPGAPAYTFIDYELDPAGFSESIDLVSGPRVHAGSRRGAGFARVGG